MDLISKNIDKILTVCKEHDVEKLYAFGSVLNEKFSHDSDVDLLVKFKKGEILDYFDNYLEMKDSLEKIFERQVDLLEEQTIRNPVLKRSIDRNKMLLYG
jgi:predicted nucleotidyltransferase